MPVLPRYFLLRLPAWTRIGFVRRTLCLLIVVTGGLWALDRAFPIPLPSDDDGVVVVAQDGTPLRTYPSAEGVWRYRITPEEVSPYYLQALIGYEDQYFYGHRGINPIALARAGAQWAWNGRIVSGGSTLSMQVARILDGPHGVAERSIGNKILQILRAWQLEAHLSKRDILTLYLNHAPMGGIVEGVEMASRKYLGKPAKSLSRAEAALLVALPQSPSKRRPDLNAGRAQAARDKVLERMVARGYWSRAEVDDAKIEKVIAQPIRASWLAPLAAERLKREAENAPRNGTSVIRSTIDTELQTRIEALLQDRVRSLPPKVSIAALVMENDTLAVRAYVGSADFSDPERSAHVDMTRRVRSPGSALKPFLYAMALDEGLIHSESLMVDAPQSFGGYSPGNFQAAFSGAVSVSEALQRSLNVPAVDLLDRYGPVRFASTLRNTGMKLRMEQGASPNVSLILGGGGTTLEELVGAYRALAVGGIAGQPRLTDAAPRVERRVMSEGAAWIVRDILEAGGRPDRPFDEGGSRARLAWKTGTSFGFRDAWALGVTDRYTLGIWMGRPDGTPNPGYFGANSAAPLAKDIAAILPPSTDARKARPSTVSPQFICWPLGLTRQNTPEPLCHSVRHAWVLNDATPPTLPDRLRPGSLRETIAIDARSGLRTHAGCAGERGERVTTTEIAHWPAYLEPWLPADMLAKGRGPDWQPGCQRPLSTGTLLAIRGLENGSLVRRAAGTNGGKNGKTTVTVTAAGAEGKVYWMLNGAMIGDEPTRKPLLLTITRDGTHALTAVDERGRYARITFTTRGFMRNYKMDKSKKAL